MSQITIIKVEKEKAPKGYIVTSVSYKTADGKVKGMKVYPFGDQAVVAAAFSDAEAGDVYDAQFRKNDKDFWEFTPSPVKTGAKSKTVSAGTPTPASPTRSGGNWETSEERAARQVMIVRQSSLSNAVAFLQLVGEKKATVSFVIDVAKQFEDFVMGRDQKQAATRVASTGEIE